MNILIATLVALSFGEDGVYSFQSAPTKLTSNQALRSVSLFGKKSSSSENIQQDGEEFLFGSENDLDDARNFPSDEQISSSLNRKVKELELGIGKRYVIRTQRGFLNVHYEVRTYSSQFRAPTVGRFLHLA
jgi:hypothetical protein